MTNSPAQILATWLIASGYLGAASASTWPVLIGLERDYGVVTDVATAYDTAGVKLGRVLAGTDGTNVWRHGVQFRYRSKEQAAGWTKAEAVNAAVQVIRGRTTTDQVTISTVTYTLLNVSQQGPTFFLGRDGPRRKAIHTVNYLVTVRQE